MKAELLKMSVVLAVGLKEVNASEGLRRFEGRRILESGCGRNEAARCPLIWHAGTTAGWNRKFPGSYEASSRWQMKRALQAKSNTPSCSNSRH
jgi:hypothetical protein